MRIRAKFMLTISAILITGVILIAAWIYYISYENAISQAIRTNGVLSGVIHEAVARFMRIGQQGYLADYLEGARKFESVKEIRIIRSASLEKEIGVSNNARAKDDWDRQVLRSGQSLDKEVTVGHERAMRRISPILMDETCRACHASVKEGEVMAALSITYVFQSGLDQVKKNLIRAGLVQGIIIVLVLGAIFILFNKLIMNPLSLIRALAQKIGGGDLSAIIDVGPKDKTKASFSKGGKARLDPRDEIGELAVAFNKMSHDLRETSVSRDELLEEVDLRKKLEQASRDSERFLQRLMNSVPNPVFYKDRSGVYLGCSRAFETFFGILQENVVGGTDAKLFTPEEGKNSQEKDAELFAVPGIQIYETVVKNANGQLRNVIFSKATFSDASGNVQGLIGVILDITHQKQNQQQLIEDKNILEKKSEELDAALKESLLTQEALSRMLEENNQVREQLEQSVAEVKKNQQMLLQSEKLASIGQLAAGIAHEINNPTGFIGSNIATLDNYMADITRVFRVMEALKTAVKEGDLEKAQKIEKEAMELEEKVDISYIFSDADNLLRESKEGVVRIANIVRDLKIFSHTQEDVFIPSNLCKIIDGVINIVWNEIKYKAELKKDYSEDLSVTCNPQQIGQVIINILVNAAQAIKDKGVISIKTYASEGFAHIDISDTGCGISKENLNKIFDAFFTTKEPGKGTGLGLGISAAIMKKHGGTIKVESEQGKGTTFKISLPINTMKGV